jgi:hypothetical protein
VTCAEGIALACAGLVAEKVPDPFGFGRSQKRRACHRRADFTDALCGRIEIDNGSGGVAVVAR